MHCYVCYLFFFIRHCNPCGVWPAQLSLSILSRKVFTECRCQRHVKPPNLEDQWFRTFQLSPQWVPSVWRRKRTPVAESGTMGEKLPRILPKVATSTSLMDSFTCRKFTTWDRRLYFPSEGRRAEEKSGGFGRVWTRELGYQRPARLPLGHRSRFYVC